MELLHSLRVAVVEIGRHMINDREWEVYRILHDETDEDLVPRNKIQDLDKRLRVRGHVRMPTKVLHITTRKSVCGEGAILKADYRKPFTSVPPLTPGPPGLPLLGSLPFLEPNLHRCSARLSEIYGPIMKLQLGRKLCVVISSPSLAKQVFKDHDAIFANRDPTVAAIAGTYGGIDILWSPSHDTEWRKLRKIFVQEMISKPSLDACYALRRQKVRKMVKDVYSKVGSSINIGEQMFITILNVIISMSWGSSLNEEDRSTVGIQFRQVVDQYVELWGAPNMSDLFPVLARFDLQGIESKMKKLSSWFDRIFKSVIDSRTKNDQAGSNRDFLEILLELSIRR
ncbi:hypothetical protein QYF36_015513 [Acer negundo]|nr:hypothetical protein QYF36_015513 [Acer negundo]